MGVLASQLFKLFLAQSLVRVEFASVRQNSQLDEKAVAVLQGGEQGARVFGMKEMALDGIESPFEVVGKKGFRGFEKIAFPEVGNQVGDQFFGNRSTVFAQVSGQFAGFLDA